MVTGMELAFVRNDSASKTSSQMGTERPQQAVPESQQQAAFQNCLEEQCNNQKLDEAGTDNVIEAEASENEKISQGAQNEGEDFFSIILFSADLTACLEELKQVINSENLNSPVQLKQVILDKIQEMAAEGKISILSNETDTITPKAIKMPDLLKFLTTEATTQGKTAVVKVLTVLQEQAVVPFVSADNSSAKAGQKDSRPYSMEGKLKTGVVVKADVVKESTEPVVVKTENVLRNVMEYESNRLANRKLSNPDTGQTALASKTGGDEPTRELITINRLDNSIVRSLGRDGIVTNSRPTSTVDFQQLIDQVVKKVELLVKLNSSEMKIDLKPEFLGKMTIKIAVEEGVLTARFITDNHQVKHLLDSNLNTLKQNLEAQGIKVEKAEVNVQLNNGGMFDGSEYSRQSLWDYKNSQFIHTVDIDEEELITEDTILQTDKNSDIWQQYNGYENNGMSFLI